MERNGLIKSCTMCSARSPAAPSLTITLKVWSVTLSRSSAVGVLASSADMTNCIQTLWPSGMFLRCAENVPATPVGVPMRRGTL
jgi:hypothetical protein